MNNKKTRTLLIIILATFVCLPVRSDAAGGFTKRVKHPDNQITDGEAVNLMMKPGQKQQVAVELENYGDKETTVLVKLSGARTNGSGGLEYSPSNFKKDKSMKYDLSDLVKVPEEVKIPAKGKKDLVLDITMPDVAYDGVVTGGVQLMEKDQGVQEQKKDGSMIVNKMAFLFGVTLQMDKKEIKPDFDVRKAYGGQENYRNAMLVDLANTQSMIAKNMTLNVDITKTGKSDVLYTRKKTDVSIAPNTLMTFPVSLDGERMKAGKYTANIVLKGYDNEWKWTKDYTITDEEADKFNQDDVYVVQERGLDWKMIGIIVGSVLGVGILIFIIFKVTKKSSGSNSKSKKNSKKKKSKK